MTNNEENYKNKECPIAANAIIVDRVAGSTVFDAWGDPKHFIIPKYCNTTRCAAWQICGVTTTEPIYGCRFIERGYLSLF
jgi:hypothetical protein